MKDEPAIVSELREEERLRRLSSQSQQTQDTYHNSQESIDNRYRENNGNFKEDSKGQTIQVNIDIERRLIEAEERYEKIFRLSPEAIVLIDKTGTLLDMNERLYDWLGYRSDEIVGQNILELPFLTVDEKVKAKNHFIMRMSGREVPPYELEFITKTGEKRIGLVRGTCIKNENGIIVEDLLMISDVTEQKKVEETLHRMLENFKELEFIVNHSGAIAFLWRAEEGWPVEFVSENITQFGYTNEDFLSNRISYASIIHKEDLDHVVAEVTKYSQQGAKEFTQEYRVYSKSGEVRWIEDRTWIRRDKTNRITHYQGIIFDITERKKTESELKKAQAQLCTFCELQKNIQQKNTNEN